MWAALEGIHHLQLLFLCPTLFLHTGCRKLQSAGSSASTPIQDYNVWMPNLEFECWFELQDTHSSSDLVLEESDLVSKEVMKAQRSAVVTGIITSIEGRKRSDYNEGSRVVRGVLVSGIRWRVLLSVHSEHCWSYCRDGCGVTQQLVAWRSDANCEGFRVAVLSGRVHLRSRSYNLSDPKRKIVDCLHTTLWNKSRPSIVSLSSVSQPQSQSQSHNETSARIISHSNHNVYVLQQTNVRTCHNLYKTMARTSKTSTNKTIFCKLVTKSPLVHLLPLRNLLFLML